ncbi:hypothetical protein MUK71_06580 [Arthrobacter zhangbolii]|uniref:Lipoprotein n=1 Tax=Arthrobacter zhangbolii TaxID=2886936 RepID=A0A9X1S7W6_9MICC|nr:hypothetical protein [Arthrobacter zhangbolii]MCC3271915.1 hypothetical protein [Arthrobacter zhangbolii]MCC3293821.1 hypothetical protein [Arthrobacter zhangbolii]UON93267.1 hypothetical protein MUK71_06580 [Arthrobacter zhangbolii]
MKKSLTALSAVVLLLVAAGCTEEGGTDSPASAAASQTAGASLPAQSGPASTPSASASPVALADGFPTTLIPVMDGAEIRSSTVDRTGTQVSAVLVETTTAPAADVFAFYDKALTAQGFTAAESAAGAPASRDYIRTGAAEPETVNVTVTARTGEPSTVTVGATVLTESVE